MKKIVLCGGGTLGHLTPNIAIYENLKDKYNFFYICSKNGMEKQMLENVMPYYEITTAKLKRNFSISNVLLPFLLIKGIFEAKKILKKEKPDLIFSKGGFASVPVVLAGKLLKIPCITHESDQTLGLANKFMANKCKFVCTSFAQTAVSLPNGIYTGNPIRKQIFNGKSEKILKKFNFFAKNRTILVLGGSLGSQKINALIRDCLPKLNNYNIIHITGKNKIDKTINKQNYAQIEFASNIEDYYAFADIVITRGGSNTLFELLALNKPMIIIPLGTKASRGDQIENAKVFKENGFANIVFEENLTTENLIKSIDDTFNNIKTFTSNINLNSKNGVKEISKIIEKVLKMQKKR